MGRWAIDRSMGFGLGIDPYGHMALWVRDGTHVDEIRTEITLIPRCCYFVAASFDATTGRAELHLFHCINQWNSRISTVVPFQLDAWVRETLRHAPTTTGADDTIPDTGPQCLRLHGVNRPVRCMTGFNWRGGDSYRLAPETFGGVHQHDDAMTDCQWDKTFSLTLPDDLPSGAFCLRIAGGDAANSIPFIVCPKTPKAKLAVLLPTFTYLAYANEHLSYEAPIAQAIAAHDPVLSEEDLITDHDLHAEGLSCLAPYKTVLNGTHPDYYSEE